MGCYQAQVARGGLHQSASVATSSSAKKVHKTSADTKCGGVSLVVGLIFVVFAALFAAGIFGRGPYSYFAAAGFAVLSIPGFSIAAVQLMSKKAVGVSRAENEV